MKFNFGIHYKKLSNLNYKKALIFHFIYDIILNIDWKRSVFPGVAQFGSALEWGSRGRRFDSCHSDHNTKAL